MQNGYQRKQLKVAVIGGGLVGSLEALFLAKRGHRVDLYEYRADIRSTPQARGRSINLALSHRGRRALRQVGLESRVVGEHGIPMRARMIHRPDGTTYAIPYDASGDQCIYSVGRNFLNGLLLEESEKYPNIQNHFNHKLSELDVRKGSMKFLQTDTKKTVEVSSDLVVGADGAFSAVRRALMKQPLFNFSQQYIEHGYLELCIPADAAGGFQMPANYLHIWPRGTFMMIALPNQDSSWTVTLFMPFTNFQELDSREKLEEFFDKQFPDAVPLIGKDKLVEDFFAGTPSPLVAIKCRPYHVSDKVLLLGDAAHAVVPFYGQGMNAGFEDCFLLDRLFTKHGDNLAPILREFSETRWPDAHAISDLAMYNYIEMRQLVTRPTYRARKWLDELLQRALPTLWVPLYNSVTFTDMPYSECRRNRSWQDKILFQAACFFMFLIFTGVVFTLRALS